MKPENPAQRAHRKRATNKKPTNKAPQATRKAPKRLPGIEARNLAVALVREVLDRGHAFDEARAKLFESKDFASLSGSDKGLARLIAATVLRLKPALDDVIGAHLSRPLPKRAVVVDRILLCAAAQLCVLKTPPHAAINNAVEQTRRVHRANHMTGLVNAVLRKVSATGPDALKHLDLPRRAIPGWLWRRWVTNYGEHLARDIAQASLQEPALDITVKADPESWARRLNADVLSTGSLRTSQGGRVLDLEGFDEGAWWVQDAAAALPACLLGNVRGKDVADLCAAPGGKTAQLAAAGGRVVAVDRDRDRLNRVEENFKRLGLEAECIAEDVRTWKPGRQFDFVLLDAPCSATGTIRRHPDILHLKREDDIATLALLQKQLLDNAFALLRPGGTLVYCTCSLEPEEGEQHVRTFLKENRNARLHEITAGEQAIRAEWLNSEGMLRTLPCHDPRKKAESSAKDATGAGMDGFFAARIHRA